MFWINPLNHSLSIPVLKSHCFIISLLLLAACKPLSNGKASAQPENPGQQALHSLYQETTHSGDAYASVLAGLLLQQQGGLSPENSAAFYEAVFSNTTLDRYWSLQGDASDFALAERSPMLKAGSTYWNTAANYYTPGVECGENGIHNEALTATICRDDKRGGSLNNYLLGKRFFLSFDVSSAFLDDFYGQGQYAIVNGVSSGIETSEVLDISTGERVYTCSYCLPVGGFADSRILFKKVSADFEGRVASYLLDLTTQEKNIFFDAAFIMPGADSDLKHGANLMANGASYAVSSTGKILSRVALDGDREDEVYQHNENPFFVYWQKSRQQLNLLSNTGKKLAKLPVKGSYLVSNPQQTQFVYAHNNQVVLVSVEPASAQFKTQVLLGQASVLKHDVNDLSIQFLDQYIVISTGQFVYQFNTQGKQLAVYTMPAMLLNKYSKRNQAWLTQVIDFSSSGHYLLALVNKRYAVVWNTQTQQLELVRKLEGEQAKTVMDKKDDAIWYSQGAYLLKQAISPFKQYGFASQGFSLCDNGMVYAKNGQALYSAAGIKNQLALETPQPQCTAYTMPIQSSEKRYSVMQYSLDDLYHLYGTEERVKNEACPHPLIIDELTKTEHLCQIDDTQTPSVIKSYTIAGDLVLYTSQHKFLPIDEPDYKQTTLHVYKLSEQRKLYEETFDYGAVNIGRISHHNKRFSFFHDDNFIVREIPSAALLQAEHQKQAQYEDDDANTSGLSANDRVLNDVRHVHYHLSDDLRYFYTLKQSLNNTLLQVLDANTQKTVFEYQPVNAKADSLLATIHDGKIYLAYQVAVNQVAAKTATKARTMVEQWDLAQKQLLLKVAVNEPLSQFKLDSFTHTENNTDQQASTEPVLILETAKAVMRLSMQEKRIVSYAAKPLTNSVEDNLNINYILSPNKQFIVFYSPYNDDSLSQNNHTLTPFPWLTKNALLKKAQQQLKQQLKKPTCPSTFNHIPQSLISVCSQAKAKRLNVQPGEF